MSRRMDRERMSVFTWTKDEEWVEGWIEAGWVLSLYLPKLRMKNERRRMDRGRMSIEYIFTWTKNENENIRIDRGRMSIEYIFTWTKDEEWEEDRDG